MVFQGKTVEDAISAGLKQLGIAREDAEITVLEQGRRRLFGSIPAKVEITEKVKPQPLAEEPAAPAVTAAAPAAEPATAGGPTDGERAVEFLKGLFPLLGSEAVPTLAGEDEKIVINLEGEAKGIIGRRGEVIDAVQTLAGAVANTGRKEYKRVVVDYANYREEREETLKRLANKLAAKAVRLGKRVRLEPMNPYERRIIHSALVDNEEVTTKSEGKEPVRYVVITPKKLKNDRRGKDGKDGRKGRFDKRGGGRKDSRYGERKPYPKRDLPAEATPETSGTSFSRGSTPGYKKGGFSGFFGTFLGKEEDEPMTTKTQSEAPMSETEGTETTFRPEEE